MLHPVLLLAGIVVSGAGVATYGLTMRDLVRRGRMHRWAERQRLAGAARALPEGRVPCPECAEGILPAARRCPFCRSVVTPTSVQP